MQGGVISGVHSGWLIIWTPLGGLESARLFGTVGGRIMVEIMRVMIIITGDSCADMDECKGDTVSIIWRVLYGAYFVFSVLYRT